MIFTTLFLGPWPHQDIIGDVNILSRRPKWTLYTEIREGKIGGMASTIRSKFYNFPSDHHAMLTSISWKIYLTQEFWNLKGSLEEEQYGKRILLLVKDWDECRNQHNAKEHTHGSYLCCERVKYEHWASESSMYYSKQT